MCSSLSALAIGRFKYACPRQNDVLQVGIHSVGIFAQHAELDSVAPFRRFYPCGG